MTQEPGRMLHRSKLTWAWGRSNKPQQAYRKYWWKTGDERRLTVDRCIMDTMPKEASRGSAWQLDQHARSESIQTFGTTKTLAPKRLSQAERRFCARHIHHQRHEGSGFPARLYLWASADIVAFCALPSGTGGDIPLGGRASFALDSAPSVTVRLK